jgi:hypothetical protein
MDPRPNVGFAIKTSCTVQAVPAQLYINFCHHAGIGAPVNRRGQPVSEDELARGVAFLQVPIDCGTWRKIPASESGKLAYIVDVIYNKTMIERLMNDAFCRANGEFREHLFELAMKTVEQSLPSVRITRQVTLVKKCRYLHARTEDGGANEGAIFKAIDGASYAEDKAPAPAAPEPLIEEVKPRKPGKPLVKKGFLNGDKAKGKLYGEEGSKEGVLPENAGDPLGYLPKKLRSTCKVVDCNDPQYAGAQAQPKQSAESEMWKDMMGSYEAPSVFGEDGLDKDGPDVPVAKYSNDYARFDRIADAPDAPEVDSRDWYYAEDGTYKSRSDGLKKAQAAPAKTAPAPAKSAPAKSAQAKATKDAGDPAAVGKFLEQAKATAESAGMDPAAFAKQFDGMDPAEMAKKFKDMDPAEMAKQFQGMDPDSLAKDFAGLLQDPSQMDNFLADPAAMEMISKMGFGEEMLGVAKLMADGEAAKAAREAARSGAPPVAQKGYPSADPAVKKGFLDKPAKAARAAPAAKASDTTTTPPHTVVKTERGVQCVVQLPKGVSMSAVELDVSRQKLRLACPGHVLECDLPCPVDANQSRAKFRKATSELVVTVPEEKTPSMAAGA